jgi:hypothetical protein
MLYYILHIWANYHYHSWENVTNVRSMKCRLPYFRMCCLVGVSSRVKRNVLPPSSGSKNKSFKDPYSAFSLLPRLSLQTRKQFVPWRMQSSGMWSRVNLGWRWFVPPKRRFTSSLTWYVPSLNSFAKISLPPPFLLQSCGTVGWTMWCT